MKRPPLPPRRTASFSLAVNVHSATPQGGYQAVRRVGIAPQWLPVTRRWLPALAAMMVGLTSQSYGESAAEASVTAPERKPAPAAKTDCALSGRAVKSMVEAKPEIVLAIVDAQIVAHPACSCEIVKAAIISSKASAPQVARIVETAIMASPENMRPITQCALAVAPDALPHIQQVLAKLDPAAGRYISHSAKDSKDAKEVVDAVSPNPLDFIGPDLPPNEFPPRNQPPGTPPDETPGTELGPE